MHGKGPLEQNRSLRTDPGDVEALAVEARRQTRAAGGSDGARAVVVNRTHRVVREQAIHLREQREKTRSLWVPLIIVSALMVVICYAIWAMMDGYDLTPTGIPDASDQLMILLLWSLPVTAVVLGAVWFRRGRGRLGSNGEAQQ